MDVFTDPRLNHIRNFCIVAHIDHGKSTLADRLLEITHTLQPQQMKAQVLDDMDLEREKGITIKSHAIAMEYRSRDGERYELNLIDTPGHVDFTYEVSRSLAACEGAILVVDASQGIEAQTLSNYLLARQQGLAIVGAINKVDLLAARPDDVALEIEHVTGVAAERVLKISAKTGMGVEELLEQVIRDIPPPGGDPDGPLRALIFDSKFDQYRGVVALVRVVDGNVRAGDAIRFLSTGKRYEVSEVGRLRLKLEPLDVLSAGEVGYVVAGVKSVAEARVGDTLGSAGVESFERCPASVRPSRWCSRGSTRSTPSSTSRSRRARKLRLNDAALMYEPETSVALGFDSAPIPRAAAPEIVQGALRREFQIDLIATTPSVEYRVLKTNGDLAHARQSQPFRAVTSGDRRALRARARPDSGQFLGNIMKLCQDRAACTGAWSYVEETRARLTYRLPLAEIVLDFYDRLKSVSRHASLDYELQGTRAGDVVKLDILLNDEPWTRCPRSCTGQGLRIRSHALRQSSRS